MMRLEGEWRHEPRVLGETLEREEMHNLEGVKRRDWRWRGDSKPNPAPPTPHLFPLLLKHGLL